MELRDVFPEKYYLRVTILIMLTQLIHLTWLATDVLFPMVLGTEPLLFLDNIYAVVAMGVLDFLEVPFILMNLAYWGFLYYKNKTRDPVINVVILGLQIIHIFWLTDEIILNQFETGVFVYPLWLAIVFIAIDYLELKTLHSNIMRLRNFESRNSRSR